MGDAIRLEGAHRGGHLSSRGKDVQGLGSNGGRRRFKTLRHPSLVQGSPLASVTLAMRSENVQYLEVNCLAEEAEM